MRTVILIAIGVVFVLCAVGCASMATTKEKHDDFTGQTTTKMGYNVLSGAGITGGQVRFNPVKVADESNNVSYAIQVVYLASSIIGWCFIESGESLHLLIDGERVHISGNGSVGFRDVLSDGGIQEIAAYPVTADLLRKLANAKAVRVKIDGSRYSVERHFSETNTNNLKEFVAKYVDAS